MNNSFTETKDVTPFDFDLRIDRHKVSEACRRAVIEQIMPFWMKNSIDKECGGYITCLDERGKPYDYDKLCLWAQGRIAWTCAFVYNELNPSGEYLDAALHGLDFLEKHAIRPGSRMPYSLSRDGNLLVASQDVHVELSTILALAEYSRATGEQRYLRLAEELFSIIWELLQKPGKGQQPVHAETRAVRSHGHSMIVLNVLQVLRKAGTTLPTDQYIDLCIAQMLELHLRPEKRILLEMVGWQGEDLPGWRGRWINPGHMIEGGIFLIHEGEHRNDSALITSGLDLIEWGFEAGWDKEFGGIFNDCDAEKLPIPDISCILADCKLWWQHAEAFYGLLLAWDISKHEYFAEAFDKVCGYVKEKFLLKNGEWLAILDRRGNPIGRATGTDRKNTFHIVRNYVWSAAKARIS